MNAERYNLLKKKKMELWCAEYALGDLFATDCGLANLPGRIKVLKQEIAELKLEQTKEEMSEEEKQDLLNEKRSRVEEISNILGGFPSRVQIEELPEEERKLKKEILELESMILKIIVRSRKNRDGLERR